MEDDIIAVDRPFGPEEAMIAEADAPPLAPSDDPSADEAAFDEAAAMSVPEGTPPDDPISEAATAEVLPREAPSLDGLASDGRPSDGRFAEDQSVDGEATETNRPRRRAAADRPGLLTMAMRALSAALLVAVAGLFIWRSDMVRLAPSLAGFYHLFGLEVNLRGLQLHEVRAVREAKDGIPILTIEGFVFNPGPKPAEVPKLRMAILGAGGRELYVWTAEPPQPMLKAGESLALRSHLASPPADGQEVMVRFLHKRDLLQKRDLANSKP
ncbi:MAG: hypothetical protein HC900_08115 [Methylacidiphilales bacterium]|nr:hypothetical protein [Candidatus Methylacidiphilales bacterium]